MSVRFPTRPTFGQGHPSCGGEPTRASHCQCKPRPLMLAGQDTCQRCGRHLKDTISDTWQRQAERLARAAEKRRAA